MNKEKEILKQLTNYYETYHNMPSIRELMKLTNYKSTNSIYRYLQKLINDGYLQKNKKNKLEFMINPNYLKDNILSIPVINTKEYLKLEMDNTKEYLGFKMNNDDFKSLLIKRNDYLIIEKTKQLSNDDLGLFLINKQYRVMIYHYLNGFYILEDKNKEILYKVTIIGKVVSIYRKKI